MSNVDAAIRVAIDRDEITQLVYAYGAALDARDLEGVLRCYTPEVEFRSGSRVLRGHRRDPLVDGRSPAIGDDVVIRGLRYEDDVVRTPDGWRIRRRVHQVTWQARAPATEIAGPSQLLGRRSTEPARPYGRSG